jgi:hypothetical protein
MEQSRTKRPTDVGDISRTDVGERVVAFLRALYETKWHERVAADLRVSVHTIKRLDERKSAPSAPLLLRMILRYGPEFLKAVLPPAFNPLWLDAGHRAEQLAALEADIAARNKWRDELKRSFRSKLESGGT